MSREISEVVDVVFQGEDVLVSIRKPKPPGKLVPYGRVTEYIRSLNLKDVDYEILKKIYKNPDQFPQKFAKNPEVLKNKEPDKPKEVRLSKNIYTLDDLVSLIFHGDDVFIKIDKPVPPKRLTPYGRITEFLGSFNLREVDYNTLRTVYKNPGAEMIEIAKRSFEQIQTEKFTIEISEDRLTCYVTLSPVKESEPLPEAEQILNEMESQNVVYGLQQYVIKKALHTRAFNKKIIAAKGIYPIPGEDEKINLSIPADNRLNDIVLKLSDSDLFEKFEFVTTVKSDDRIAEIEPLTKGTNGATVHGDRVFTIPGLPLEHKGRNVNVKGRELTAAIDGRPLMTSKGLEVEPVLVLREAREKEIRFTGSIKVRGDLSLCPLVQATGDIEVHGVVTESSLVAGRNIVIHENILSRPDKSIVAGGDFISRHVSYAKVIAENIFIVSTAFNSELTALNSIVTIDPDSRVVGGHLRAGLKADISIIGNESKASTKVSVSTPEILRKYKQKIISVYDPVIEKIKNKRESYKKKLSKLEELKKRPGEKYPSAYNWLYSLFFSEMKRCDDKLSQIAQLQAAIKEENLFTQKGTLKTGQIFPSTTLYMGHDVLEIEERTGMKRFVIEESKIRETDKENSENDRSFEI